MPRSFAKVNIAIWQDPDFRRLPPAAQHLYLMLWTAPELSFCGVHDWRPARLSHLSHGFTEEHTTAVGDCLAARYFFVIDTDTEEVLIRSWARFDEVVRQPRLAVSYANAYASTYSENLRAVLVHEAHKMQKLWPELPCWKDSRVSVILDHPAISAKDLPVPSDPFGDGFGDSLALGLAQASTNVWPRVSAPPTTAATTTTNNGQHEAASPPAPKKAAKKSKPGTQLPDDFKPSQSHIDLASSLGVDLRAEWPQFVDHHRGRGSVMKDWPAVLRTWIRNAPKFGGTPKAVDPDHLPPVQESWMRLR